MLVRHNKVAKLLFNYFFFLKKKRQPPVGFCKKDAVKNFENFTEKHLCLCAGVFLITLQAFSMQVFLKRDSNWSASLWNFQNF